ncbi:hypothetical protein [Streptomyces sp. NPDC054887]
MQAHRFEDIARTIARIASDLDARALAPGPLDSTATQPLSDHLQVIITLGTVRM